MVLKLDNKTYINLTGPSYKKDVIGEYNLNSNEVIIHTSYGNNTIENCNISCKSEIVFINNNSLKGKNYNILNYPNYFSNCGENNYTNNSNHMKVEVNFDNITKHLLIQRILNNYYIFTGIIFILIGIFLCFFGFYQNIAKIIICIIFGELITFAIFVIYIGISVKYLEILFIFIGIVIGVIISIFSIKYINFYIVIISITAGTIIGIFLLDITFIVSTSMLIGSIILDNIIISSISFLIFLKMFKKYYIFLNSIIGGYILIRGISILLFKYLPYRELQLIIYFIGKFEWEFFENNNDEKLNWKLFWIYDILILTVIILSIFFYYFHSDYLSRSINENESDADIEENIENEEKEEK